MTKEIALHCMKSASELTSELCEECPIYGQTGSDHCFEDALQYVIGMLEQEICEDAVSRQAVLAIAGDSCLDLDSYADTKDFCDKINELPSVTPKTMGYVGTADFMTEHFKFCNHCGAKMVDQERSE